MLQNNFLVKLVQTDIVPVDDETHPLPPWKGLFEEYKVADYYCPSEWSKDGIFVPVKEGEPLWFDFRPRTYGHDPYVVNWDCAVLCSIQKVNPVTGERINLEDGLSKDPVQNYLRLPEQIWLDGFVNEGKVYQFVITKSGIGIAVNEFVLPEFDQDSHALAFAFFRAKHPKSQPEPVKPVTNYPIKIYCDNSGNSDTASHHYYPQVYTNSVLRSNTKGIKTQAIGHHQEINQLFDGEIMEEIMEVSAIGETEEIENVDKASMGAGGRIDLPIVTDNNSTDYYEDEPTAILTIYLALPEQFKSIMKKDKRQDPHRKDKYIHSGKIGNIQVPLVKK